MLEPSPAQPRTRLPALAQPPELRPAAPRAGCLRAHLVGRHASDRASARSGGGLRRRAHGVTFLGAVARLGGLLGKAEIQDLHASVFGKNNLVRWRVAVGESLLAGRLRATRDL